MGPPKSVVVVAAVLLISTGALQLTLNFIKFSAPKCTPMFSVSSVITGGTEFYLCSSGLFLPVMVLSDTGWVPRGSAVDDNMLNLESRQRFLH